MRVCRNCQVSYEDFGQKACLCRDCKRAYDRDFHSKRSPEAKAKKIKQQEASKDAVRQFVYDYLKTNPCISCGEDRIACLQFDHLENKKDNVGNLRNSGSIKSVIEEISKCRVLCANCHSIHTAEQFGWYSRLQK